MHAYLYTIPESRNLGFIFLTLKKFLTTIDDIKNKFKIEWNKFLINPIKVKIPTIKKQAINLHCKFQFSEACFWFETIYFLLSLKKKIQQQQQKSTLHCNFGSKHYDYWGMTKAPCTIQKLWFYGLGLLMNDLICQSIKEWWIGDHFSS